MSDSCADFVSARQSGATTAGVSQETNTQQSLLISENFDQELYKELQKRTNPTHIYVLTDSCLASVLCPSVEEQMKEPRSMTFHSLREH